MGLDAVVTYALGRHVECLRLLLPGNTALQDEGAIVPYDDDYYDDEYMTHDEYNEMLAREEEDNMREHWADECSRDHHQYCTGGPYKGHWCDLGW